MKLVVMSISPAQRRLHSHSKDSAPGSCGLKAIAFAAASITGSSGVLPTADKMRSKVSLCFCTTPTFFNYRGPDIMIENQIVARLHYIQLATRLYRF